MSRLVASVFVVIGVALIRMVIHIGLILVRVGITRIGVVIHFLLAISFIGTWSHGSIPPFWNALRLGRLKKKVGFCPKRSYSKRKRLGLPYFFKQESRTSIRKALVMASSCPKVRVSG